MSAPTPLFKGENAAKLAKAAGPASVKAVELFNAWQESSARLREVYARANDARAHLQAAVTALHVVAGGIYDPEAEAKAGAALEEAKKLADPVLHRSRETGEQNRLAQAADAYNRHLIQHGHTILEELTPAAERVTAKLAEVRAAALAPEAAYREVRDSVQVVVDAIRGPQPAAYVPGVLEQASGHTFTPPEIVAWQSWSLPTDESLPLPADEAIAAHVSLYDLESSAAA